MPRQVKYLQRSLGRFDVAHAWIGTIVTKSLYIKASRKHTVQVNEAHWGVWPKYGEPIFRQCFVQIRFRPKKIYEVCYNRNVSSSSTACIRRSNSHLVSKMGLAPGARYNLPVLQKRTVGIIV